VHHADVSFVQVTNKNRRGKRRSKRRSAGTRLAKKMSKVQGGAMKHLNVKWVPETFAIVSLTIATTEASQRCEEVGSARAPIAIASVAPTKLIVISGSHELQAAVTTTMPGQIIA
jgi:hypothetical protein